MYEEYPCHSIWVFTCPLYYMETFDNFEVKNYNIFIAQRLYRHHMDAFIFFRCSQLTFHLFQLYYYCWRSSMTFIRVASKISDINMKMSDPVQKYLYELIRTDHISNLFRSAVRCSQQLKWVDMIFFVKMEKKLAVIYICFWSYAYANI